MRPQARLYRKRDNLPVTAVQLDLDFGIFNYQKWGGEQKAKPGDWLVLNNNDTYTVDQTVFASTYQQVAPGQYTKTATIWAWPVADAGTVATIEGSTVYQAGDYLVADSAGAEPSYAITAASFERFYQTVE